MDWNVFNPRRGLISAYIGIVELISVKKINAETNMKFRMHDYMWRREEESFPCLYKIPKEPSYFLYSCKFAPKIQ